MDFTAVEKTLMESICFLLRNLVPPEFGFNVQIMAALTINGNSPFVLQGTKNLEPVTTVSSETVEEPTFKEQNVEKTGKDDYVDLLTEGSGTADTEETGQVAIYYLVGLLFTFSKTLQRI